MMKPNSEPSPTLLEELRKFSFSLLESISLWHWIGYGLLVLALIDVIALLFPPQIMNPAWEFQTIGGLVERVAVPLIGFLLVFYGEQIGRENWEFPLVKLLSWLTLLIGVLFFLLIPLGVVNTIRLDKQAQSQISSQVKQNITQIQEVKKQLATTQTAEEMETLLRRLDNQGRAPDIQTPEQLQIVKNELSTFISNAENQLSDQANTVQSNQRLTLLKNSIKWNLGALISGALFIIIWRSTRWAR